MERNKAGTKKREVSNKNIIIINIICIVFYKIWKNILLATLSSSLRCESAAEHHTVEQYSQDWHGKTPKRSQKKRSVINTCKVFFMIPSL